KTRFGTAGAPAPSPAALSPDRFGSTDWLRATVSRFVEGPAHARRRALVEEELSAMSPLDLRRSARRRGPIDALALALGVHAGSVTDAVAAVAIVANGYPSSARAADQAAADSAVATLIELVGPQAGDEERLAARISVLVQSHDATIALIDGVNVPVPALHRRGPDGEHVVIDVAACGQDLMFGGGRRPCPGREQALALVDGTADRRRADAFRAMHHGDRPLVLPNAWDVASASALVVRGFGAVGTTSLGVAAAIGLPDGAAQTLGPTLELARRLGRLPVPVSVDFEGGFHGDPAGVADLIERLADMGIVGVNLEDGLADGSLQSVEHHAAVVTAVKDRCPHVFVNARTDTHWPVPGRVVPDVDETRRRVQAYVVAGADGVFVPGLEGTEALRMIVAAVPSVPVNVLWSPDGPSVAELGDLGVRRVSLGSLLFRVGLGAAVDAADAIATDAEVPLPDRLPAYADIQAASRPATAP
ncbi:MAG: isocitrate lyase/phosphoenolpyruvate mutase family protein, partial [Ilumatobacteraceae bacterium]